MKPKLLASCLMSAMLGAGWVAPSANAAVVYREVFGRASEPASALDLSVAGWGIIRETGAPSSGGISNQTGRPTNLFAVNATSDLPGTGTNVSDLGFVNARWSSASITDTLLYLFHTTEYTLVRPTSTNDADTTFSLQLGLSDSDAAYRPRLAVEVGEQWYVAETRWVGGNVPNEASFDDNAAEVSLSLADTEGFRTLDITAQSGVQATLTIGATTSALPAGDITGFGLLAAQASGVRVTFDTFTIAVVPEPAVPALAGLAGLLGMRRRRRPA